MANAVGARRFYSKEAKQKVTIFFFFCKIVFPSLQASDLVPEHGLSDPVAVDVLLLVHEIHAVFLRKVSQHVHRMLEVAQRHRLPADVVTQTPLGKVKRFSILSVVHRCFNDFSGILISHLKDESFLQSRKRERFWEDAGAYQAQKACERTSKIIGVAQQSLGRVTRTVSIYKHVLIYNKFFGRNPLPRHVLRHADQSSSRRVFEKNNAGPPPSLRMLS